MSGIMTGIMVSLFSSVDPSQAELIRAQMEAAGQSIPRAIINGLIFAVLLIVFSTLGGLLGVPIFEKRKGNVMPPQPQNFS
jgi:p-aminobenzoyl-glutamate transporter AbgT